jgi:hypothetical protein
MLLPKMARNGPLERVGLVWALQHAALEISRLNSQLRKIWVGG